MALFQYDIVPLNTGLIVCCCHSFACTVICVCYGRYIGLLRLLFLSAWHLCVLLLEKAHRPPRAPVCLVFAMCASVTAAVYD